MIKKSGLAWTIAIMMIFALILVTDQESRAADLARVVNAIWASVPPKSLEGTVAPPPFGFRGTSSRGPTVYRQRVSGVVLIASEDGIGSGSLVSNRGDIVTAEHVVHNAHREQGADWVLVWFKPRQSTTPDKNQFLPARVIYRDMAKDLALIRLAKPAPAEAAVIPLAGNLPEVGQDVFAIGHPESYFWTFTQGVVSQIRAGHSWKYSDGPPHQATVLQTQTPTNPGSSGGPLFDEDGALVGVLVGGKADAAGLYFAVVVGYVQELLRR